LSYSLVVDDNATVFVWRDSEMGVDSVSLVLGESLFVIAKSLFAVP
jgi:hypothetical protein